jgi:hypothetical protein
MWTIIRRPVLAAGVLVLAFGAGGRAAVTSCR